MSEFAEPTKVDPAAIEAAEIEGCPSDWEPSETAANPEAEEASRRG